MKDFHRQWLKPRWNKPAGASRRWPRALRGAQGLTERILQRYALRGQPRQGGGMQYLQFRGRQDLPQALRLALTLTQRIERAAHLPLELRLPGIATGETPAPPSLGSQGALLVHPPRQPVAERLMLVHLPTANRLRLGSHRRLELGTADLPPRQVVQPAGVAAGLTLARPVAMIARPAPPAAPATTSATASAPASLRIADQADIAHRRAIPLQASAPAGEGTLSLPPAELRRVTEQVIQEIDKRIIANRERFGRM